VEPTNHTMTEQQMSIEDGLTYRHKAYANSMKAYRQAHSDWKEQQIASEEYAQKWMETSARAYQKALCKAAVATELEAH